MAQDIAALKGSAIGGLLKHQVLRKMLCVVVNMQARDEEVCGSGHRKGRSRGTASARLRDPKCAEGQELVARERSRGAGITPTRVPCIFEIDGPHIVLFDLLIEDGAIDLAEVRATNGSS
jgi:hypothetical protein